jgi:sugar lactone lactonase YvrE
VGVVTGVVVDSQERVYVCQQQQEPPVMVFDREGNYLDSWGSGHIKEPHTMFIGKDGGADEVIYLADRGDHIALKLTLDGQVLLELGNRGVPSDTGCFEDEGVVLRAGGPFNRPTRMSPSPSGDLYVSDGYRNSRVHRFSGEGSLIASWGQPGSSTPGEFYSPHSLWVDSGGQVYVCDRKNNRIQIFSPEGKFISQWGNVRLPTDLHIGQDGVFYLAEREDNETQENFLTVRDVEGNVLASWPTPRSHQIWPDSHGDIYLVNGTGSRPAGGVATKYIREL